MSERRFYEQSARIVKSLSHANRFEPKDLLPAPEVCAKPCQRNRIIRQKHLSALAGASRNEAG
jgi:hypothetical protein